MRSVDDSSHDDARSWFAGNKPLIEPTAFRNSTLQGAYFMIAARYRASRGGGSIQNFARPEGRSEK